MSTYEETRQRHFAHLMGRLPQHLARLGWSPDQLRAERTTRLRNLLGAARAQSAWHRAWITVKVVDSIPQVGIGKLKRFVPIDAGR